MTFINFTKNIFLKLLFGLFLTTIILFYLAHNLAWADWDRWRAAVDRKDYQAAFEEVWSLAQQGDAEAQYMVGYYFSYGKGVEQNEELGSTWMLTAANNGSVSGMNGVAYDLALKGENLDQALSLITKALTIDPDNPYYLDTHAWVLYQMKRYEEALEPMCRSVKLLPGHPEDRLHLGHIYFALGLYYEARNEWLMALDLEERRFLLAEGNPEDYLSVQNLKAWREELKKLIINADQALESTLPEVKAKPCTNPFS
ncbi:MAG TPA: CDC27 family protein [Alphaproteobacteria bacterium]|jgi:tetratricopeptide (TPR) repeat protein|nr:CDC27 family protein [Alphaproteobacteria bacterium]